MCFLKIYNSFIQAVSTQAYSNQCDWQLIQLLKCYWNWLIIPVKTVKLDQFSSITWSCPTLQHHELQHARPPCPSPTPGAHPNPCPLSQWCHPIISSFVILFSCPQSFPTSGSFPMSQLFSSGGQRIGVSAATSVLPMNIQLIFFRMDWLDFLAVQGNLKILLQRHSSKASILRRSAFFIVQLSHPYMTTEKTIALTRWTFVVSSWCFFQPSVSHDALCI